ncbi:MAG: Fic family protein [Micrococcaceae bacterium]
MAFTPNYGETPISPDNLVALTPEILEILNKPVLKADVYDIEQEELSTVATKYVTEILEGNLAVEDFLNANFLRQLHEEIFGDIWNWAGKYRTQELNLGVAPEQIPMELPNSFDNLRYRWENTNDLNAHQLGVTTHIEGVRVHPFVDGNGRTTRLHADLVFLAALDGDTPYQFDWNNLDRKRYIDLLNEYDRHRDPSDLAELIKAIQID